MTTIRTKKLQALNKLASKDNIRFYANGVYLNYQKGEAVVSDSHVLLQAPIEKSEQSNEFVSKSRLDEKIAVAKALKQETVDLTLEDYKDVSKFPPYENAFPKSEMLTVSFDLANLKKLITAMEAGVEDKRNTKITFAFETAHRPVKITCDDMTGLIVPLRTEK